MEKLSFLYKAYFSERHATLTPEQFETFVLYTPPLMVVACDNIVDRDEWMYVEHFSEFISRTFRESLPDEAAREQLHQTLKSEMRFVLDHMEEWESPMLEGVHTILKEDQDAKAQVYELLEMFADSSDGISEEEQTKIDELCQYLEIKTVET